MICKRCFQMSDDDLKVCPYCGAPLTDDAPAENAQGHDVNTADKSEYREQETQNTANAQDNNGSDGTYTPPQMPQSPNGDYHVPQGNSYGYNYNYMPPYGYQGRTPPPYVPPVKPPQTKAQRFFSGIGHAAAYVALFFFCQIVVTMAVTMVVTFNTTSEVTQKYLETYGEQALYNEDFIAMIQGEVEGRVYESLTDGVILNVISIVSSLITVAAVMLVGKVKRRTISDHIWLYPPRSWKILLVFPAAVALQYIIVMLINVIPWPDAIVEQFNETYNFIDNSPLWLSVLSTVLLAPITEEIIFRACVYGRLRRGMPVLAAGIISAFTFGLAHGVVIAVFYATLLGLILAYVYEKFGTILAPMLLHIGFNSANYILLPVTNDGVSDSVRLIALAVSAVVFIVCAAVIMLSDVGRKEKETNE